MICKISIVLLILSICSLIDSKRLFFNNDDELELSNERAQMFLSSMLNDNDDSNDESLNKREFGIDCVRCKFGLNPCCKPNICVKKFFWDECMEIKIK